jgi:hypothetical protein
VFVVTLHDQPTGQSVGATQPHFPLTHAFPAALREQSTHVVPLPHVVDIVPSVHIPPRQQ